MSLHHNPLFKKGRPGRAAGGSSGFNHWQDQTYCNKESSAKEVPNQNTVTHPIPRKMSFPLPLDNAQIQMLSLNRFKRSSAKGRGGSRQRGKQGGNKGGSFKGANKGGREARKEARRRERQSRRFEVNFSESVSFLQFCEQTKQTGGCSCRMRRDAAEGRLAKISGSPGRSGSRREERVEARRSRRLQVISSKHTHTSNSSQSKGRAGSRRSSGRRCSCKGSRGSSGRGRGRERPGLPQSDPFHHF